MNKRERFLFGMIIVLLLAALHLWLGRQYMDNLNALRQEKRDLDATLNIYQASPETAQLIAEESKWLKLNKPSPATIQESQSKLQEFITKSSESIGFDTYGQKLIELQETGGEFETVKIQVSARATEKELYQWFVNIHQPSKFRALTYLRLTPDKNDLTQVVTTLAAEQIITPLQP